MKNKNEIKRYIKNDELDLEKIIDEFSGYVYKIIKNIDKFWVKGGSSMDYNYSEIICTAIDEIVTAKL